MKSGGQRWKNWIKNLQEIKQQQHDNQHHKNLLEVQSQHFIGSKDTKNYH